jgi:hypothetical protein
MMSVCKSKFYKPTIEQVKHNEDPRIKGIRFGTNTYIIKKKAVLILKRISF